MLVSNKTLYSAGWVNMEKLLLPETEQNKSLSQTDKKLLQKDNADSSDIELKSKDNSFEESCFVLGYN